jgi:periplasmic mercuric ion binding protein
MKKVKIVLFLILCTLAKGSFATGEPKTIKIKTSAVCGMCKRKIEKNLAFEKGVEEATLDLNSKIVTISYNPKKTNPIKLKKAIANTGYDADEVDATEEAYNKLSSCCKKDVATHAE